MLSKIQPFVDRMIGWPCWYVGAGGSVGSSFSLALGGKRQRQTPVRNSAHPEEYRLYEGEGDLLVWCSWRLDSPSGPITSSDQDQKDGSQLKRAFIGKTPLKAIVRAPAWDLELEFSEGYRLVLLCDHLPGDHSIDTNWELRILDQKLYVGPGHDHHFVPEIAG